MFPSTLIISTSANKIQNEIARLLKNLNHDLSNNPDLFQINRGSGWGIDQVRQLTAFFSQKPYNHTSKIAVIFDADHLTAESQNALLKTLEEPGDHCFLILTAPTTRSLIPTIVSRCHTQIIRAPSPDISNTLVKPSGHIGQDLSAAERVSPNKDEILPWLNNQLLLTHRELIRNPTPSTAAQIRALLKSINMVNVNVDPRSALDYFFLS